MGCGAPAPSLVPQGGKIRIKTPEESHLEYLALALQHYGESVRLGHAHVLQVGRAMAWAGGRSSAWQGFGRRHRGGG